jgi:hypothetical protein
MASAHGPFAASASGGVSRRARYRPWVGQALREGGWRKLTVEIDQYYCFELNVGTSI